MEKSEMSSPAQSPAPDADGAGDDHTSPTSASHEKASSTHQPTASAVSATPTPAPLPQAPKVKKPPGLLKPEQKTAIKDFVVCADLLVSDHMP